MTKHPTYEQRMVAIEKAFEKAFEKLKHKPIPPLLIFNIEALVHNEMLHLFQCGEISKMPITRVTNTITGEVVDENMKFVKIYDNTSLSVSFIDPYTMETI